MKRLLAILLLLAGLASARAQSDSIRVDSAALHSLQLLRQRADNGDSGAVFRFSRALETGYGNILRADSLQARRLLEKAAQAGYAPAQNYLGFRLFSEHKTDSAINWLMKAADQGDITAYSNLGWMLLTGQGALRDTEKALYWLKKGADAGSAPAAAMLADMYRLGDGVTADTTIAIQYYDRALHLYSLAPYRDHHSITVIDSALGDLYAKPDTIATPRLLHSAYTYLTQNASHTGIRLLQQAAARDNALARARLGREYALGHHLPYNHLESLSQYTLAAIEGNPSAQFIIGELLQMLPDALSELPQEIQNRLSGDMRSAQYWLEKAALAGIDNAADADRLLLSLPSQQ